MNNDAYNTPHLKHLRAPLRAIEAAKIVAERKAEEERIAAAVKQGNWPPNKGEAP